MASEAAVLEMEKKAAMRKRMNKAQADFNANNTVYAQNMAREQADNNVMREAASSAHERFMQSRRQYIERNKFAVSPFEFAATMGYKRGEQNPADLRAHELKMVDKKNEGAIGVAAKNAEGMANQGVKAAEINAGVKEKELETGLKKHELEMQNRKDLTTIQANAQKSLAEGQNKTTLENTRLQGENAVRQQSEANKGLLAQSELKAKAEQEKLEKQTQQKMLELQQKSGIELDKSRTKIITEALNGKKLDETEADVFARLKETYKNDPAMMKFLGAGAGGVASAVGNRSTPKEGMVQTTPSGKKAVFRSGKWVIEG